MKILSTTNCTIAQVHAWLDTKNPHPIAKPLAELLWEDAIFKGVNPLVAVTQAMKETGFFKYTGVLRPNYCNTCGLKGNKGGGDLDPKAHTRFDYWEDGISAHIDHLALYAGAVGYPKYNSEVSQTDTPEYKKNGKTLDPRHFPYLLGDAPNVEDLSTKWAPSKTYGEDIIKMCKEIEAIVIQEEEVVKPCECNIVIEKLQDEIISLQEEVTEYVNMFDSLETDYKKQNVMLKWIDNLRSMLKQFLS